jgi:hypothetical protein
MLDPFCTVPNEAFLAVPMKTGGEISSEFERNTRI